MLDFIAALMISVQGDRVETCALDAVVARRETDL